AEFKQQTEADARKQVELALIHNGRVTASGAPPETWEDMVRATRPEARETIQDGDDRVSIVQLSDGPHDFFSAQLNGYEGVSQGSVGNLFFLRNRVERV